MANGNGGEQTGWMSDVQRAIALDLIVSFTVATLFATVCSVIWPDHPGVTDMAKTLQAALVNMSLIALGFFFGNTMAKMQSDAKSAAVVDKLTSTPPGTLPPVPTGGPTVVVAWWSLLTDVERAAVAAAAPNDPKVAAFMAAAQAGNATPAGLADLVSAGLLTQARADAIKGA